MGFFGSYELILQPETGQKGDLNMVTRTRTNFKAARKEYNFSISYISLADNKTLIFDEACVHGKNLNDAIESLCGVIGRDRSEFTIHAVA